ncbi:MAG: imidazolonepropionase [Candidatus Cloacimonetes bacterium]|nr:imidazolonepropionase [Candidatus Cloacimonadota bacterium]
MTQVDLIIHNIGELLSIGEAPHAGSGMRGIGLVKNAALAIDQGKIVALGTDTNILDKYQSSKMIDAGGKVVTPGFVDPHSHPVFVHTREHEFAMRLAGKSYVEIALAGGGIRKSIQSTRDADEELLFSLAKKRISKMIALGTTTLEAKSGYGLSLESELKQLKVIARLKEELPIDLVATFMGAHEYPAEYKNDHASYLRILTEEMLPAVREQGIAEFCDIFTEAHVYSIEDSRMVLSKARKLGFGLKMHADEIEAMGGAELAAEMNCISADHLGAISDNGIRALGKAGVVPVLLPATLFSLRSKTYAPARKMIDSGLPVALATDYNPGSCNCDSMSLTITLACLMMNLSPEEAICAATFNAAKAIGKEDRLGSLECGKQADFIVWDIPSYNFIPYHFGSSHITEVWKHGRLIYKNQEQLLQA